MRMGAVGDGVGSGGWLGRGVGRVKVGVLERLAGGAELVEWWGVKMSAVRGIRACLQAVLLAVVAIGLVSCESTESKKKKRPLKPASSRMVNPESSERI